jgi:ABC-type antimicrobial peptide transport system permease subunit
MTRPAEVQPSGVWARDLGAEAVSGLFARPGRTFLTVLGTVIGLGALVATLGLSRTASSRIIGHFDELAATEITVTPKPAPEAASPNQLPWDAPARLMRLNGVVTAGNLSEIDVGDALVSASLVRDPQRASQFKLGIVAASPQLFTTAHARLREGRTFDLGHSKRGDRVAVLGPNAAVQLGISRIGQLPAIMIGDEVFLVVGVLDSVERQYGLLSSVIIPEGTARDLYRLRAPGSVVIETKIGAAALIGSQAPLALQSNEPSGLKIATPTQPQPVRNEVRGDLNVLFLALGAVSLLVGAIGIANVTLVSVMERTGEIGLRRALGATRWHIAWQFLLESASMGMLGGIVGACLGLLVVVGVSTSLSWTPVIDATIPLLAPLVGGIIGLLAGSYPAARAARMEPVEALRVGM